MFFDKMEEHVAELHAPEMKTWKYFENIQLADNVKKIISTKNDFIQK